MNEHFKLTRLSFVNELGNGLLADIMRADSVVLCESSYVTFEGAYRKRYLMVEANGFRDTRIPHQNESRYFEVPIDDFIVTITAPAPIYSPRKEFAIFKTFDVHKVEKAKPPVPIDEKLHAFAIKPTPRYFNEHFKGKIPSMTDSEVDHRGLLSDLLFQSAISGAELSLTFPGTIIGGKQAALLIVEKESVVFDNRQLVDEFIILIGEYVLTVVSEGYVSAWNGWNDSMWFGFIAPEIKSFKKQTHPISIQDLTPIPNIDLAKQQLTNKLFDTFKAYIVDNRVAIRAYLDSLDS